MINVRKALKGLTYKLGTAEWRVRRRTYSRSDVLKMDRCRKKLAVDKTLRTEVAWEDFTVKSDCPRFSGFSTSFSGCVPSAVAFL